MNSKYEFYEVVKINSERKNLNEINGQAGAILGKAQNDKGEWLYSVHLFETEINWEIYEKELESTGNILTRGDFYKGNRAKVIVDAKTGKGYFE